MYIQEKNILQISDLPTNFLNIFNIFYHANLSLYRI